EGLVGQRPLNQRFRAGRNAWRPHRGQWCFRVLQCGGDIDADAGARGGPLRQQRGTDPAAACAARPAQQGGGNIEVVEVDHTDSAKPSVSLTSRKRAVGAYWLTKTGRLRHVIENGVLEEARPELD